MFIFHSLIDKMIFRQFYNNKKFESIFWFHFIKTEFQQLLASILKVLLTKFRKTNFKAFDKQKVIYFFFQVGMKVK
jgi:hypothetical protein